MKRLSLLIVTGLLAIVLVACDSSGEKFTVGQAISAFEDAGLEVDDPTEMSKDDFGLAPMKSIEAKRFLIPSLGGDSGGRIFSFDNDKDLEQTKAYYDDLGKESAMLFSHTSANENILIQVNGDLEEDEFSKYEDALNSLE